MEAESEEESEGSDEENELSEEESEEYDEDIELSEEESEESDEESEGSDEEIDDDDDDDEDNDDDEEEEDEEESSDAPTYEDYMDALTMVLLHQRMNVPLAFGTNTYYSDIALKTG
ncbi:hypothetical protein ElyMa_004783900 [Elysia marginata]|uniref:Uncharacterized protein n=1 Tax=Elysia marginata TaxID=1093978 RepID=A0AAV4IIY6_9GAST|nr:hypothetical protein ElyMa_004783900 [Elysia marginata]